MTVVMTGKVLVTGVNGFLGTWVAKKLLEEGFAVRGTVRSDDKSVYLKKLYSSFGERFEYAVVPDITKVKFTSRNELDGADKGDYGRTGLSTVRFKVLMLSYTSRHPFICQPSTLRRS